MIREKFIHFIIYALFLTPLLGYLYIAVLHLPKSIYHLYTFGFFFLGIMFVIFRKTTYFPTYLYLLFGYASYRFLWLKFADINYHILTRIYYSILYFSIFLIILVIYNTKFSRKFIEKISILIKATVIIAVAASFIQGLDISFLEAKRYWIDDYIFQGSLYTVRRNSIFGFVDQNELGLSFLPLASVLIGYLLLKNDKKFILYMLLVLIIGLLSNTRYVMVGAVIMTIQVFIAKRDKIVGIFRYVIVTLFLGFVAVSTLISLDYDLERFFNERLFKEGSITQTTRYKAISNFAYFFPKNPVFGTGVHLTDEIREASRAVGSSQIHVGYLSHLVSYGLVGSALLFGFWFFLLRNLYKNARRTGYWGSFTGFLIFLWAQATLVYYPIYFVGIIMALVFDKYHMDSYEYQKAKIAGGV